MSRKWFGILSTTLFILLATVVSFGQVEEPQKKGELANARLVQRGSNGLAPWLPSKQFTERFVQAGCGCLGDTLQCCESVTTVCTNQEGVEGSDREGTLVTTSCSSSQECSIQFDSPLCGAGSDTGESTGDQPDGPTGPESTDCSPEPPIPTNICGGGRESVRCTVTSDVETNPREDVERKCRGERGMLGCQYSRFPALWQYVGLYRVGCSGPREVFRCVYCPELIGTVDVDVPISEQNN